MSPGVTNEKADLHAALALDGSDDLADTMPVRQRDVLNSRAPIVSCFVSSAVTLCPADERGIPEIQRLADEIWRRHYPGIISDGQIEYMLATGYSTSALRKFFILPDAGAAIARKDGSSIAFAAWYPIGTSSMLKLDKLYVLPQHQRGGAGRALIEYVVARARAGNYEAVTLNVNRGNATAIAAYERCGFSIRERGDFPIGGGFVMEDYVMVRDL